MKTYETPQQLAERTGFSVRFLADRRQQGLDPAYIKVGRRVLYCTEIVDAWLALNAVHSTAESAVRDARAGR